MGAGDHIVGGWQVYATPGWDDLRFPLIGRNLDTASGRIDYNYTELGVDFAANSRYNAAEQLSFIIQMPHSWMTGSDIYPHLHWIQGTAAEPNWLIEYRGPYDLGSDPGSTWVTAAWTSHAVTYSSGTIHQFTRFPTIDMSGASVVSSIVDIKIFRDVANGSGEFAGAEGSPGVQLAKEFDIHFARNRRGSISEASH